VAVATRARAEREQTEHLLVCAECAAEAPPGAFRWRACLIVGDEDAEDVEGVAMFCPECVEREFG
jgi:ribosomal protein L40E